MLIGIFSFTLDLNSQTVGEYRSRQTGNWNVPGPNGTWEQWNGTAWVTENLLVPIGFPEAPIPSSYPVIENTATYQTNSEITNHSVTLPTGITSGDLLLMVFRAGGTQTATTPSGWSLLDSRSSHGVTYVWYRTADGSEGSTVTVTTGGNIRASAITYRISNWEGIPTSSFTNSNTNDPPSISPIWGASNSSLFIAALTNRRSDSNVTAAPTNYSGLLTISQSSDSNHNRSRVSTAHRFLTAASEDPDAFTTTGNINEPHSVTIAIRGLSHSKATVQNTHTVTITNDITVNEVKIESGGTVVVNDGITLTIPAHGNLEVNGTLQMGTDGTAFIAGDGNFNLNTEGALGITSVDGIATSGATGNIQNSGTRSFNTSARYIYNGDSAQSSGNGLPATVANLKFDNSGGAVTLNSSRTITGSFSITSGSMANLGTFTHNALVLILGGSQQITGSWGSTSSPATNQNDTYFATTTGIVNVSNQLIINSTGTNSFVVPEGVTSFSVEAYGGGGRGGERTSMNDHTGFGGGGGGGYSSKLYTGVTPLTSYNFFVGAGSTSNSNNGQDSWFESNAVLLARGGITVPNNSTSGANGGALGIGDIIRSGGNGGNGGASSTPGGGGGSSAGTNDNGTNATGQSGAVAPTGGGNGGNGGSAGVPGTNGSAPGGGGGGGYRGSGGMGTQAPGNGANGLVIITINAVAPPCTPPDIPALSASETTICNGEEVTISITSGNLNDASSWQWYTGSCGGTPAGTGTSIMASPTTTTTYYVRGEGDCTNDCAEITITVNSLPSANINGNDEICQGDVTELTASGGVSYEWSNSETTAAITVSTANTCLLYTSPSPRDRG
jgi:hypothetical protein